MALDRGGGGGAESPSREDGLQFLPAGLVPLMATQMHTYQDCLRQVVQDTNKVYTDFRLSEEGQNFQGQVSVCVCLCVHVQVVVVVVFLLILILGDSKLTGGKEFIPLSLVSPLPPFYP